MSRWPQKPLLEVARLTRGTEPGSGSYTDSSRGIRFLRVGDITGKTNNPAYTDAAQTVLVSETDVLLALDGSPGHLSTGHRGAISSGLRKVEPIDPHKVSLDWLRYSLMSPDVQHTISKYTNGVTILHASSAVPHVSIPIPPLSEQERLVQILDEAEELRELRAEADRRANEFIPALFSEMFGNPDKTWPVAKFSEMGTLDRGKSKHRPRNEPSLFGGLYPFVQTGDIANCGGRVESYSQTYSELGLAQSKLWPKDTLCITIAANIARCAILTFPACFPDSVVGFIPNERVTVEFAQSWLETLTTKLEEEAPQAAQKNINLQILRNLELHIPPIELQLAFTARMAASRAIATEQTVSRQRVDDLFQSLLHRAFQGEL
jgi:type I restriction enzyme, S subunit